MQKLNVAILAGGYSSEYGISIKSGEQIFQQLNPDNFNASLILVTKEKWVVEKGDHKGCEIDKNNFSVKGSDKKFDVVFIAIHGTPGEDGMLQGYFDFMKIPYSSCDRLTSSLTFNKYFCNTFLRGFGIQSAKSVLIRKWEEISDQKILEKIQLPMFVKPNNGGSSFGISKVKTKEELMPAIEKAFDEDNEVILEEFIDGIEVTCGVFKSKGRQIILPLTEIVSKKEFFDFEAKYTDGMADEITPARINEELTQKCQQLASEIYDLANCKGIVRIDFILKEQDFILLEINTIPGMTQNSIVPKQAKCFGISLSELFELVIYDAIQRANHA